VQLGLDPKKFNQGIDATTAKLKATGGQFKKVGMGMSAALFKIGSDYDSMVDTIRIGTGATGDALQGLADDAIAVFKTIPTSMDLAGQAVSQLTQKTGLTGQALQDLARSELELARITGGDLNAIIDSTTDVFNSWGIATNDQVGQLDKLMRASQASGVPVETLAQQLAQFGPTLRGMGLDIDQSTALLASLSKAGLDTGTVVAGLKKAFVNFTEAGVTDTNAALNDVITRIKNAPDDLSAAQLAMDTFGNKAGGALADAIRSGAVDYQGLLDIIQNGDETVLGAAAATNDWKENLQILQNRITAKLIPAANWMFAKVNEGIPILEKVVDRGERFIDWLDKLSPTAKRAAIIFGVVLAAIGPVLIVIGTLISIAAPAIAAISAIGGAIATVTGLISLPLLPLLLIIAAIVLLAVAWHKNWFDIQGKTKVAVGFVMKYIQPVIDIIKLLGTYWHDVATNKIQPGNLAKLPGWLQPIALIIGRLIKTVRIFIKTWQDKGFFAAMKIIPKQIHELGKAIKNALSAIGLERFGKALQKQLDLWVQLFSNVISLIGNLIHGRWKAALSDLANIATTFLKLAMNGFKMIVGLLQDIFEMIPWTKIGKSLVAGVVAAFTFMRDTGGPWLVDAGKELLGKLGEGLADFWDTTLLPWLKAIPGKAADALKSMAFAAWAAGLAIMNAVAGGLAAVWLSLSNWLKGVAAAIIAPFADAFSAVKEYVNNILKWYHKIPGTGGGNGDEAGSTNGIRGVRDGGGAPPPSSAGASRVAAMGVGGGTTRNVTVHATINTQATDGRKIFQELMAEVDRVTAGAA